MKRMWKVLIAALAVALLFAAAACAQAEGVLKGVNGSPSAYDPAFEGEIIRNDVLSLTFVDTLADAPSDAWDVSEAGDGSVLAWAEKNGDLYDITIGSEGGVQAPGNSRFLFKGFEHLKEFRFNDCFDTSHVTDMRGMFEDCWKLTELDLRCFDTSGVQDMSEMFIRCVKLRSVDLSSFDTSNVKNMSMMFDACSELQELNLTSFDTSKVEDMGYMFSTAEALEEVYVSDKFVIGADTRAEEMFKDCPAGELTYTSAPAAGEEAPAEEEAPAAEVPAEAEAPAGEEVPAQVYEEMRRGDKGDAVARFQAKLVEHNYLDDIADGDFGGKTEAAVKQVQADAGLEQTGIADAETQAALENLTAEYAAKGDNAAMLYWGEYDAEKGVMRLHVKNQGKNALYACQFVSQQCNESKKVLGNFMGNHGSGDAMQHTIMAMDDAGMSVYYIKTGETYTFEIPGFADGEGDCEFFADGKYASFYLNVLVTEDENGEAGGERGDSKKKIYVAFR